MILTDEEWSLYRPTDTAGQNAAAAGEGGGDGQVVNGVMYVLSTGCQWRYIPKDLPPKSTVHDYLTRWNYDRTIRG